ncbi:MAG: hypothetical protein Q7V63_00035 [Gammaproteobacteria bacterium]|nr:hypothetical protein [Gammaproteobacteria bacterium]
MTKKIMFVMVASALIALAMAGTAYANVTSTWASWVDAGDNALTGTPHYGYLTTTTKCAVCHAVHKAGATNEVLLQSSVSDACTYCHITTATGVKVIYTDLIGGTNFYSGTVGSSAHNTDGGTGLNAGNVRCVNCHAVHGAGAMTGNVASKILKSGGYQSTNGIAYSATGTKVEQVSLFCTKCHPYFMDDYAETVKGGLGNATDYRSHVMKASGANYTNAAASFGGALVAYAPSTYCTDCHDAGATTGATGVILSSFPHYTPGAERFLRKALHSTDAETDAADANFDGVCLKCHATGTGSEGTAVITGGIGVDF